MLCQASGGRRATAHMMIAVTVAACWLASEARVLLDSENATCTHTFQLASDISAHLSASGGNSMKLCHDGMSNMDIDFREQSSSLKIASGQTVGIDCAFRTLYTPSQTGPMQILDDASVTFDRCNISTFYNAAGSRRFSPNQLALSLVFGTSKSTVTITHSILLYPSSYEAHLRDDTVMSDMEAVPWQAPQEIGNYERGEGGSWSVTHIRTSFREIGNPVHATYTNVTLWNGPSYSMAYSAIDDALTEATEDGAYFWNPPGTPATQTTNGDDDDVIGANGQASGAILPEGGGGGQQGLQQWMVPLVTAVPICTLLLVLIAVVIFYRNGQARSAHGDMGMAPAMLKPCWHHGVDSNSGTSPSHIPAGPVPRARISSNAGFSTTAGSESLLGGMTGQPTGMTSALSSAIVPANAADDVMAIREAVTAEVTRLRTNLKIGMYDGETKILSVLGHGGFGTVYHGEWRGLEVAVKTVIFQRGSDQHKSHVVAREAAIASNLVHPNVVVTYAHDLKDVQSDTEHGELGIIKFYLIQEFCNGKNLRHALVRRYLHADKVKERWRLITNILIGIAKGMAYVHSKRICHGDLNPSNVLLKYESNRYPSIKVAMGCNGVSAKVADFGLARHLEDNRTHQSGIKQGTPFYIAPEVSLHHRLGPSADVYAFGIIMWELIMGCMVFQKQYANRNPDSSAQPSNGSEAHDSASSSGFGASNPAGKSKKAGFYRRHPSFPDVPPSVPLTFTLTMKACLSEVPTDRPSFAQVLTLLNDAVREVQGGQYVASDTSVQESALVNRMPTNKLPVAKKVGADVLATPGRASRFLSGTSQAGILPSIDICSVPEEPLLEDEARMQDSLGTNKNSSGHGSGKRSGGEGHGKLVSSAGSGGQLSVRSRSRLSRYGPGYVSSEFDENDDGASEGASDDFHTASFEFTAADIIPASTPVFSGQSGK